MAAMLFCFFKYHHIVSVCWCSVLTSNLLGEFDALRVRQWLGLFVDVLYVQNLAHELDHRLSAVESCRRH